MIIMENLLVGFQTSMAKGLTHGPILIESDFIIVLNSARSGIIGNWCLEYSFQECIKLFSYSFEIIDGYRQKNHVADRLAAAAHLHKRRQEFFRIEDRPKKRLIN